MKKQIIRPIVVLIFGLVTISTCNNPGKIYDLIIQNATVVDGTGQPPYSATIAIKNNKIAKISRKNIDTIKASNNIDAIGLIVAPGFIDMHTNVTVNIQNYPNAENFIRQGVTTLMAS